MLLIATVLPFATALTKTGAIDLIVRAILDVVGGASPYVVLTEQQQASASRSRRRSTTDQVREGGAELSEPEPLHSEPGFGRAVGCCASTRGSAGGGAITPVSSPVNTLVMNAGDCRFGDVAKLGAPLLLITWLTTLLVVPWFFPFAGE